MLQRALNKIIDKIKLKTPELDIPKVPESEIVAGTYGSGTQLTVRKYKAFNAVQRQGQQLDDIIGRMTITQMDNDLINSPSPPGPSPDVVIEVAQIRISSTLDELDKDDLQFGSANNSQLSGKELTLIVDMSRKSTQQLQNIMLGELRTGDAKFGPMLANAFFLNAHPPRGNNAIVHQNGSDFSNMISRTALWRATSIAYKADLAANIALRAQLPGSVLPRDIVNRVAAPRPSWSPHGVSQLLAVGIDAITSLLSPGNSNFAGEQARMLSLVGSFQGGQVFLRDFKLDRTNRSFEGTLIFELIDHFGVDTSDITFDSKGHGTAGQVAFWVLQHERHNPPGNFPYRLRVLINESFGGRF
ncbi:hypothetical protein ACFQ12_17855 [Methylobacterium trifolii]